MCLYFARNSLNLRIIRNGLMCVALMKAVRLLYLNRTSSIGKSKLLYLIMLNPLIVSKVLNFMLC